MTLRVLACLLALVLAPGLAFGRGADFETQDASVAARHVAHWAVDSGDHGDMPFVIVDKVGSRVFVFDGQGRLLGAASALVGLAQSDETVPGIGQRAMATIRPDERTTPAGRFVASLSRGLKGEPILWVDYEASIALHRVVAVPTERRLQRLASRHASERRITFGCINVSAKFFDQVVAPAFRATSGIVYVLPETRAPREVFGSYDVPVHPGVPAGTQR